MSEKDRILAFSDGVIAIAITLLVLELRVPAPSELNHGLAHYLGSLWSSYASYVLSFAVIGIIWMNHHRVLDHVARVDRVLMILNLHLLLWIAVLPFPTALVGKFIRHGNDAKVAMAVYSAVMVMCAIAFQLLWRWITRDERLLHEHVDQPAARAAAGRFGVGLYIYLATIGLSFLSPVAALAVHFAIATYYVADQLPTREAAG